MCIPAQCRQSLCGHAQCCHCLPLRPFSESKHLSISSRFPGLQPKQRRSLDLKPSKWRDLLSHYRLKSNSENNTLNHPALSWPQNEWYALKTETITTNIFFSRDAFTLVAFIQFWLRVSHIWTFFITQRESNLSKGSIALHPPPPRCSGVVTNAPLKARWCPSWMPPPTTTH